MTHHRVFRCHYSFMSFFFSCFLVTHRSLSGAWHPHIDHIILSHHDYKVPLIQGPFIVCFIVSEVDFSCFQTGITSNVMHGSSYTTTHTNNNLIVYVWQQLASCDEVLKEHTQIPARQIQLVPVRWEHVLINRCWQHSFQHRYWHWE